MSPEASALSAAMRLVAAFGRGDGVTEALDGLFEDTTLSRVVVDDQNTFGHDAKLATVTAKPRGATSLLAPCSRRPQEVLLVPKLCSGRVNNRFIAVRFW